MFPLFATGINNTSGTGGKICHQWLVPVENLPLVLLIAVVPLDWRISPQVFENF
jgi:hypothetical protein